jgi:serine protease Do
MLPLKLNDERRNTMARTMVAANRSGVIPSTKAGSRHCLVAIGLAGLFVGSLLPVQTAWALSPRLPLGGHGSRSSQGYLGVTFRDVSDEEMMALKIKGPRGAEIVLVDHDGPGCRSGLREHDVILQMNDKTIDSEEQLRRMLRETPAGRTVTFLINRDGQQQTISTQLANRDTVGQEAWERHMTVPDPSESSGHGSGFFGGGAPSADVPRHGFLGTTILSSSYTGALLEMMGPQLEDFFGAQGGLLVRSVDPDSPAAVAGMRAGDVVIKVNAVPVVNSADWLKMVHDNRGKSLSVVVLRDRKEQILTLTPDAKRRSSVAPHFWPGAKIHAELMVGALHRGGAAQ